MTKWKIFNGTILARNRSGDGSCNWSEAMQCSQVACSKDPQKPSNLLLSFWRNHENLRKIWKLDFLIFLPEKLGRTFTQNNFCDLNWILLLFSSLVPKQVHNKSNEMRTVDFQRKYCRSMECCTTVARRMSPDDTKSTCEKSHEVDVARRLPGDRNILSPRQVTRKPKHNECNITWSIFFRSLRKCKSSVWFVSAVPKILWSLWLCSWASRAPGEHQEQVKKLRGILEFANLIVRKFCEENWFSCRFLGKDD